MTFLPIVERELRVAARRRGTYWGRLGSSLLAMILFVWIYLLMVSEAPREMAKVIFGVLAGLCFLFSLLSGIRATSDCISQEKREGTLGLLFLTDLKGYDVVLGKLVATSLHTFFSLLAVFPVLSMPLLMGGVNSGEVGRMALVLVNTLMFSLAVGMFCSSFSQSARRTMSLTFGLILLVNAAPPAAGAMTAAYYDLNQVEVVYLVPSAGYAFAVAFDPLYRAYDRYFWISTGVTHGLTWALLVLASVIVPSAWQDRPAGTLRMRWRDRWKQWCYGDGEERQRFRTRLLNVNPIYWLGSRARLKPAMVWGFLGLVGAGWMYASFKVGREWFDQAVYFTTALLLNSALKLWWGSEACVRFVEDRRNNALELLLSTPLTVRDIFRGQWLALRRVFQGPAVVVLLVDALFLAVPVVERGWSEDNLLWVWMFLFGMVVLVADLYTLYWVGMWAGLTSRHVNRAAGTTVAWVMTLPWAIYVVIVLGMAFLNARRTFDPSWQFMLGLWFVLSLANDVVAWTFCRQALHRHLRELALRQLTRARGWRWWPFGA